MILTFIIETVHYNFYNALQVHLRMHEIMPETNILLLQILFFTV